MPTKIDRSAPLPSAPFRFATLTSTTRWGGGQNKTPTTNSKRKVPNLFQDLTYAQGLFFALIAQDRLYFKVDDTTQPEFEQLGMEPFRPFGEDSAMGYYEVQADVVEDSVYLAAWMKKAIDVAAKARINKKKAVKQ